MKRKLFLSIYLVAALGAFILMVKRGAFAWVPRIVTGSLPNFVPTAFAPLLKLPKWKQVTYQQCRSLVLSMLAAMCTYEFLQIWMPRRTFDWADIAASFLGAVVGVIAARILFPDMPSHDVV